MRNRAIANVFSQIGLIEAWGTGLQRIQNLAKEYGLPDVEFIEMPETFRVNLYRMTSPMENKQNIGETSAVDRYKDGDSSVKFGENSVKFGDGVRGNTKTKIIQMMEKDNTVSAARIAESLKMSVRAIEKNIRELREEGYLIRHGSARDGYWEVRM